MDEPEFRMVFTLERRQPGEDDFTEIGFGSSIGCAAVDDALYEVQSIVQNGHWETEPGMPDPAEVRRG